MMHRESHVSRREFLYLSGLAVVSSIAGCSAPEEYKLTEHLGKLHDDLIDDQGIQRITFTYLPWHSQGSIETKVELDPFVPETCRLVSRRDSPTSAQLNDITFQNSGKEASGTEFPLYPITHILPEEAYTIFIGAGTPTETYNNMRTYHIAPKVEYNIITGITGEFQGHTTFHLE